MKIIALLTILLIGCFATNLRLENEKTLMNKSTSTEKQSSGSVSQVWREKQIQIWGVNERTGVEEGYMEDNQNADGGIKFNGNSWDAIPYEEVPDWVWEYMEELEDEYS